METAATVRAAAVCGTVETVIAVLCALRTDVIDTFAFKAFVERVVRAFCAEFAGGDDSIFVSIDIDVRWNVRRVADIIVDIICIAADVGVMRRVRVVDRVNM